MLDARRLLEFYRRRYRMRCERIESDKRLGQPTHVVALDSALAQAEAGRLIAVAAVLMTQVIEEAGNEE